MSSPEDDAVSPNNGVTEDVKVEESSLDVANKGVCMTSGNSRKLVKWSILCLLEPNFLESVKIAYVFGNGEEAILVTGNDDVYSLGINSKGCSGIDDTARTIGGDNCCYTPRKVDALCNKKIEMFVSGSGPHVLALTRSGEVYSWGGNTYGEVGRGDDTSNPACLPAKITSLLDVIKVSQVACGGSHSMALSDDGKVYAWGCNSYGQIGAGSTSHYKTPYHVVHALEDLKCVKVACSCNSSFVVTDRGKVFSWGYNSNGELGIGSTSNQTTPKEVQLKDVVTKIACGTSHVLVITDGGKLYTWGYNTCGQLGNGTKNLSQTPVLIGDDTGRFVEVVASIFNGGNLSAAMLSNGQIYVWGNWLAKSFLTPYAASGFQSIDDIFSSSTAPIAMWRSLNLEAYTTERVADNIAQAFDLKDTADVTFTFKGCKDSVPAHKTILRIRSEHFKAMFSENWKESNKNVIEVEQFSYVTYKAYLQYLYTDKVDMSPEEAVDLLKLAEQYLETTLKQKCELLINYGITTKNVLKLLTMADEYNLENLKEECSKFAINHLTDVVLDKAFMELSDLLTKELVQLAAKNKIFTM